MVGGNSTSAGTPVELGSAMLNESNGTLPSTPQHGHQLKSVRQHPEKPGYEIAEVGGYPPITIATKRLRSAKAFANACAHRGMSVQFNGLWSDIVARARQEGMRND